MARSRAAAKSDAAFRTISEVSDSLQVPQHVLRFWETKFEQVQPMKRGGGRRYYRPEDIELLRQIRDSLYADGYTIKGVQKQLREGQLGGDAEGSGVSGTKSFEEGAPKADSNSAVSVASSPSSAYSSEKQPAEASSLTDDQRHVLQSILGELEAARAELTRDLVDDSVGSNEDGKFSE